MANPGVCGSVDSSGVPTKLGENVGSVAFFTENSTSRHYLALCAALSCVCCGVFSYWTEGFCVWREERSK